MTKRMLTLSLLLLLAVGLMAAPLQAKPASSGLDADVLRELAQVRRATAQYQDVTAAVDAGYVPASPCVEAEGLGGMGVHYAKPYIFEPPTLEAPHPPLDIAEPELLVYAPGPDESLQLVAVEYASWTPAELLGQTFDPPSPEGGPPFHTLHAWVWKANPSGMFAPFNPNVSC